ncbi:MAG: bifunctional acetate--CoA ligase family protein/GNAT family N-acetyltransferase [Tepidisphaeraceae bacterium]
MQYDAPGISFSNTSPLGGFAAHRHPLNYIFSPRSVAVIGATETPNSVGRTLLKNLINTPFGGTVYPVNPKRPNVLGIRAYPTIADVPEKVDLAVIVTPAASVPGIMEQCADCGVKSAIVISAGFKEIGPEGAALEARVLAAARRGNIRLIGPNCLGVMNPIIGLNATFAKGLAKPGNVAFLSQSGALLTAILNWSFREQVGFSGFVSAGSMLDVNWGDLIDYFGRDPRTRSILIYMETIGDARSFLSAAREVSLTKPIIVIKPGRTEQAAHAASSHTGSLTGGDDVVEAAFRRTGVLRVNNIADLFYMSEVLSRQPRPRGPRLTIVTNAGGPGVLATDALITSGGELAGISQETLEQLNTHLPAPWSHNNPIDVLGDAGAERYAKTLEIATKDPDSDGLLVVLTPQDMTEPTRTADLLRQYASITSPFPKPLLASWMGGPDVQAGEEILNRAGIPTFAYPDTAARMFSYMWRYTYNLRGLYETPSLDDDESAQPDRDAAAKLIRTARAEGRTLLSEHESKALLASYRIQTAVTIIATTAADAVTAATQIGFPVVLKLHSHTITHKTDVGGVKLNLTTAEAVTNAFEEIRARATQAGGAAAFAGVTVQPMVRTTDAYELILGSSIDPQFGPVLLFGTGGQLVEVFKDRSLALPPLNATLARRMMEQTKIFTALKGVRGRKPVNLAALEQLLVRFSHLVIEQPWIKEIDINPLLASPDGLLALDARVVLHAPDTAEANLPRPAIRPYPTQYVQDWTARDGTPVLIRPIRPEDEPLLIDFHKALSEETVRLRYFGTMKFDMRTAHERLTRVCFNDYDRELALVAEVQNAETGKVHIAGIGRLSKVPHSDRAEFATIVADPMQGRGIGSELLSRLIDIARREHIKGLSADILRENGAMQHVCRKLGFAFHGELAEDSVRAYLQLGS